MLKICVWVQSFQNTIQDTERFQGACWNNCTLRIIPMILFLIIKCWLRSYGWDIPLPKSLVPHDIWKILLRSASQEQSVTGSGSCEPRWPSGYTAWDCAVTISLPRSMICSAESVHDNLYQHLPSQMPPVRIGRNPSEISRTEGGAKVLENPAMP